MKAVKWIVLGIVLVVALLVAGVGIVVATLDPNDYKAEISAQVKKATGRDLSLEGDISWSLFPWLGLNLGNTSLSNAPGFGEEPFASLEEVDVHVALLPLLKKRVEAQKVVLKGVSLNLEKDRSGKDNWSDLASAGDSTGKEAQSEPETKAGAATPEVELKIGGVEVVDARLVYDDRQAGSKIDISPLNLTTGAIELGQPVPVELDVRLQQGDMTVLLELATRLTADIEAGDFKLDDLVLRPTLKGKSIPGGSLASVIRMDVHANTNTQNMTIDKLELDSSGVAIRGNAKVAQFIDNPRYSASLKSNTFSLRSLMKSLGMEAPSTTDSKVLSSAAFKLDAKGDLKQVEISGLRATLDDSQLEGSVKLTDFAAQAMRFKLQLNQIDLDRYLPPVTAADAAVASKASTPPVSDAIELPLDLLRQLNVAGSALVDQLTVNKLVFTKASLTVEARKGLLEVKPLTAHAYQGRADISAALDVRGAKPVYRASVDLKGVRSEEILEILAGDRYVSGNTNFAAEVTTSGSSISSLKKGLNGNFQAKFTEGTIRGSKLAAKIIKATNFLRKLQQKPILTNDASDETHFSVLSASGTISNGVINNRDLRMIAPVLQVQGEGSVDLPAEKLDYTASIGLPPKDGKKRQFVPLRIKGPFSDPKLDLALDDVAKQELERKKAELKAKADAEKARLKAKAEAEKAKLKARADEEKARVKAEANAKLKAKQDELKQKLEQQLNDKLKGLFK